MESAETTCVSSRGSLFTDVPVKLEIRSSGGTSTCSACVSQHCFLLFLFIKNYGKNKNWGTVTL